jgi:hypothetical protein
VKDLIRKLLRERSSKKPQWFLDWEELPVEERIKVIEERKEKIKKKIPLMIKFFKDRYGDDLEDIKVVSKMVRYGIESHSTEIPVLYMYFNRADNGTKNDVVSLIHEQFNIEFYFYAIPFDVEFFRKEWESF